MKEEREITVEVNTSLNELEKILKKNNYKLIEKYTIDDRYLIDRNVDRSQDALELLKKCILIRHLKFNDHDIQRITYKFKEYNDSREITKQGKIDCVIDSCDKAIEIFEHLNYEEYICINNCSFGYSNGKHELTVQYVNGKHIYIEIEDHDRYESIDDMKNVIKDLSIPIKNDDFFVKKAEIEILERYHS